MLMTTAITMMTMITTKTKNKKNNKMMMMMMMMMAVVVVLKMTMVMAMPMAIFSFVMKECHSDHLTFGRLPRPDSLRVSTLRCAPWNESCDRITAPFRMGGVLAWRFETQDSGFFKLLGFIEVFLLGASCPVASGRKVAPNPKTSI